MGGGPAGAARGSLLSGFGPGPQVLPPGNGAGRSACGCGSREEFRAREICSGLGIEDKRREIKSQGEVAAPPALGGVGGSGGG